LRQTPLRNKLVAQWRPKQKINVGIMATLRVHGLAAEVLERLAAGLRRVRERFRSKGVSARAAAETPTAELLATRAVQCPGCGWEMVLAHIRDARRGAI
jgi:hypothetical protein